MIFHEFQQHDLFVLFPGLFCVFASILFYINNRYTPAVLFLLAGALALRIFMAHLDPFLWDWDERYHAMVAKNLLLHPLMPTLYDNAVLPYDYTNWTANHVWVHKQPLALWQMALSYHLFGVNQFTARIPMAIEGMLLVLLVYRTGSLIMNKSKGYLAALIATVSFYTLNFMTGGEATDHIDFALTFFVSASVWAWIEYRLNPKFSWLALIGIFSGLAVLSKWTIGLVVFASWFVVIITDMDERKRISSWLNPVLAFIISAVIFLPWQIYSWAHYTTETRYEMKYNQSHLLKEVDGRGETKWYYLEQLSHNFGPLVPYIILFAVILLWRNVKRRDTRIFIFSSLIIPYFVFSVIAATKMPAYCYIACLPAFLALGSFAHYVQEFIEKNFAGSKYIILAGLVLLSWLSINIKGIAKLHTGYDHDNTYRINKVAFTDNFRAIKNSIPKDYVIFGAPPGWEIEMMYYTGNTCYFNIPNLEKYEQLKKKGIKMAIISNDKTPDYMISDPEVLKLKLK